MGTAVVVGLGVVLSVCAGVGVCVWVSRSRGKARDDEARETAALHAAMDRGWQDRSK